MAEGDRWGWSEQWDQLALVPHTCVTADLVEETIVIRVWDPIDPQHEVARISIAPLAARKLGTQLLTHAVAGEWETMGRALERALREQATRPIELPPETDDDLDLVTADAEPLAQAGRCPWCGDPALTAEDQPSPREVAWLARCGARWAVVVGDDRLEVITPCPHLPRG